MRFPPFMKTLTLILFCLTTVYQIGNTQSAQASLQIIPPYSPQLYDYASPTAQSLLFNLSMIDHPSGQADVRLIMQIEGPGISMQTNLNWTPSVITLFNGIPQSFSGFDLAEYFDPYHLDFNGMSREEFIQGGQILPDGFYEFCIKAVPITNPSTDFSNNACSNILIELYDPPELIAANGEQNVTNPQFVNFSWMPKHPASVMAEYDLEIWETQNGIPDEEVVNNYPMFYTTTVVNLTSFMYGILQPELTIGSRYVTRVRARAQNGVNLFENNGYSNITSWSFGPILCLPPENVQNYKPDSLSVHFIWESPNGMEIDEYYLEYKGVDNPPNDWTGVTIPGYNNEYLLEGLNHQGAYEFRIRSNCNPGESPWVNLGITNMFNEDLYVCGLNPGDIDMSNMEPLNALHPGDEFLAGDFLIRVVQASGAAGKFWGKGYIVVPAFNEARVNAKFMGVTVNEEKRMIGGFLKITGVGVQLISEEMALLITQILETLDTIDDWLAAQEALLQTLDQIIGQFEPYLPNGVIQQLLDAQAALEALDENSTEAEVLAAQNALTAANEAYKTALAALIAKYNSILEMVFGELETDYASNLSSLESAYETSVDNLAAQYTNTGAPEGTDFPNVGVDFETIDLDSAQVQQLVDADPGLSAIHVAANDFWTKAKDFRIAETLHGLKTDLDTSEDIQIFTDLSNKLSLDLIKTIGLKIKEEVADADIVSYVKPLVVEAITKSILAVANVKE